MSRKSTPRYLLEYAGARSALALADALPISLQLALARGLGSVVYAFLARRRDIAVDNLLKAGITEDPSEARRIARGSFKHFSQLMVETLRFIKVARPETWESFFDLQIPPAARALMYAPEEGLLFAGAHLGNWEISGQALSFIKPMVAIARPMNNPYIEEIMQRRRYGMNVEIVPRHQPGMSRLMLRTMREGKALGIMYDQHARTHGVKVDFFGRPASTHTTPALLHLATKRPMLLGCALRTGPMQFRVLVTDPIIHPRSADREADLRAILTQLNQHLEAWIRAYPEQYLWAHRRWRE